MAGVPEPPRAPGDATLAFVFDVTGSMWDDLLQVIDGASRILERSLSVRTRVANYALVPFHDPDIGPVTLTADPAVFQKELRELYVQGGGDCPEMSVGAIKAAVEVANPGSFIYVFSDARAKDYHRKEEVLQLLQLKQSQVVFVLTGDCGDRTHPGYLAFEEIAATSSGQVFHLDKQQVSEVLKWVESAIQTSKVHLLSTDHEEEGEHTWRIPFDPSLKEVTISLSGPGPEIEVRDPLGRILQKDEGLNVLLNIPDSAKVVAFKPEHPGLWSIKVYSSGRHSVRITGISDIDFRAGFSTQPSLDLNHTIEWPLQGVPISLVINSTGLQAPGHLDSVELSHGSGRSLLTLPTQLLSNESTHQLWSGPPFQAPRERFYLKVKGEDHEGNPLLRVSGVAYSGVAPGAPLVSMAPQIHGYLQQPLLVSCSVHSALPFRLQLWRDGAKLGEERHFQESGNSSWEIPRASKAEEGAYECTAVSRAGTGRAQAQIVVTDPPPQLVPAPKVTVSPGETAILSCQVLSRAPYNLTWIRDWRVLPASEGRITQLADLSLEVSDVIPADGGQYQCMASNVNGVARASVWLLVREAPQVSIHTRSQGFSQGGEVRVSCSASGNPAPHISWSREGRVLREDSRVLVDAQGTLIIQGAAPEDAGNYSCQAANKVGTDKKTVTLYYTDPPSVSAVNAVVLAAVGDEAVLVCDVSGVPPPRVIWYRGGLEMILAPEGFGSGTLRIREVQERDGGIYTCRAVNQLGDASAQIRLEVGDAPRLMGLPRDVTVDLGRSALLVCRATGRPPPTVTWRRRDGQPLGPGSQTRQPDTGALFFNSVAPEDQALYVCEARNVFGKVQAEARLTVIGHAAPQIASSASTVRVLEGQPVSLPCIILEGRPLPERRWLKAGLPLPPGSQHTVRADGSLHLARALQEDAGKYRCVVTNTAGSQQRDVELVVQVPPRIQTTATHHVTNEGIPASLPCVALGVPTPTITWTQETNTLTSLGPRYNVSQDGTLVIARPSARDAGAYVCTATNPVGFSSQEMWLSVNTKPRIQANGSQEEGLPLRVTAKAGEEVTLDCEAQGSPTPLVTWTKDSHRMPLVPDRHSLLPSGSLRLAQAQVSDSGRYQCTASNPAGFASRRYVLSVQVPPQVQPGPSVLKVLAGEALDLNCMAEGNPEPWLSWSKDGVALGDQALKGSVHFAAVKPSDAGTYSCEAASSAGVDAWELELRVLEPPHWGADETSGLLERVAGENATLPCPVRGTPKPQVVWRKGLSGEPLRGRPGVAVLDEGALFLASVSPADSGCSSWGRVGRASSFVSPTLPVPPSIREDGRKTNVSGMAGQSLTLDCDAKGFPAPEIEWLKDGQLIPEAGSHHLPDGARSLHFPRVQESDAGLYSCRAQNQAGTAQKDFELLVLIPPSVRGAGPTHEVLGLAGGQVELECRTSGVPVPQVEWTKDGQPIVLGDPHIQLEEGGQLLRIIRSHLGDEGRYQCLAFSAAGQQAKDFQLRVHSRPTIWGANETSEVAVMEGHPVRFLCEARGDPPPDITWLKDGTPLPISTEAVSSRGGRQLQLATTRDSDAGVYTCQASNAAGTAEKTTRLEVFEFPRVDILGGENITAPFLRPVTLQCVGSGIPAPSLRWWKDGVALAASGGNLKIEKVDLRDEGVYTCSATNHVPPRITLPPSLPGPVLLGAPVRLTCNATGAPSPTLIWLKDGNPVSTAETSGLQVFPGGRVLTLASARASDAGSYSCVAVSAVGEDRQDVVLQIHVPPSILGEELNVSVLANESVALECRSHATPPPVLSWWKDGGPLEPRPGVRLSADKALLEVDRAEVRDAGHYTCEALNRAGRSEKHYNLDVWVPPAFPLEQPQALTVTEGHSARLSCECHGVPFPKISWRKDGHPLPGEGPGLEQVSAVGRLLYLGQAQPSQEGTYTCECSNVAGNSSQDQQLQVHVPPQIAGPRESYTQVSVVQDRETTLECNATGNPPPTVTWERDGRLIGAEPGLQLQNQGQSLHVTQARAAHAGHYSCVAENIAGRAERRFALSVLGGWMLKITQVQEQDTGLYSCLASNEAGEARRNFSVEVLVPPSIEKEDQEEVIKVPEGQTAYLTCNATGHPQPKVRWFKDGRALTSGDAHHISPDGASLQVLQANLSSAGHYSCIAANTAGERTKHLQLSVQVVPTILGVTEDSADEEVTVTINNPISLICETLAFPAPTITWMKDGSPFEVSKNIQLLPGTHGLQILNAQQEDAGQYTCVVTNELGEAMKNYHVEVLIPPSISKDDPSGEFGVKEVKTKVNSTLTLECECWAVPPPTISWYKDGQPVTPHERLHVLGEGRLLQIQSTQVSDSGRYLCLATNVAGEDDQHFNVLIQVPPMFQKVGDASAGFEILSQEEEARGGVTEYREIVENNPAYLNCDTNAVPPPELTWYREDQPLSASDGVSVLQGGRVLQIPLVRAEDAGRYSCKASNEVGEDWLHYELLVLTPPVILGDTEELVEEVTVNASSSVSLQCPALGNPMPTISWFRNGLPLSPSSRLQVLEDGQVLQVSTAEAPDATSYMCVAENQAGSTEKLFTLRVQVPPRITGPASEEVTAILNSRVSLPCDAHAHPSPEVTWYKDSQSLSLGEAVFLRPGTHTLQLARAQLSDSGTYMCEALNAAGQDQKLVQLSVLVPPTFKQPPSGPQDTVLVRAGDKAVLNCETDALPEPTVTWYKDGQPLVVAQRVQPLLGDQRLEIPDAQVSDKGVYSCKVSNVAGEAMRSFVLTVQAKPHGSCIRLSSRPFVLYMIVHTIRLPTTLSLVTSVSGPWWSPGATVKAQCSLLPSESSVAQGVVSRGGRLQLSRLQPAQGGTYTCVAENAEAEARKDFLVAVLVAPRIRSSGATQEHTIPEGQEAYLDCEVEGQPPPDVVWLKDGSPLDQGLGPHLRFYLDGHSLVLKGLRASDSGAYTCVARSPAGEDARLHTVNVLVPPTIEQGAGSMGTLVSRPGELVTMVCPVRGSPPIHVSWLKDSLPLPLSQHTHLYNSGRTLRISQVQLADSGVFTCVAASPAGVADRNFTLHVHVPPVLEPVEFQKDVAVLRGSSVLLPCEARGSPLPLVSWMKDGEPLFPQSLEQGPGLRLETVGAADSGAYSCLAESKVGEAQRHFQLTVMDPPHIEDADHTAELLLTPGAPLELLCDARGSPPPNVTWHKDGQPLSRPETSSRAGRVLRAEGVQVGDSGLYTCLAKSPAGEVEKSFRVRVRAPPSIVGPRGSRLVVGLAPGQLVLECSVEAEPAPEIEWHRDGILLQADAHTQFPEQGRFLQLQALSMADGGNYSCTARNAAGSTSVAFRVDIYTTPTIRPGPPTVNTSVNHTALLACQADGVPQPLISWRKDGAPLDPENPRLELLPDGSLRIQPVLAQDAGHYLCLAASSAGSDRQGHHLQVLEPPAIAPGPSNLTLTAHTRASLPCEASGSPKPLVVWWKDGQKLDFRLQQDTYRLLPSNALLLADPSPQDSGQFECAVSNEVGEARRLYWVTIHMPPTIADDQTDFTVTRMAPVVLTCHSTGIPAPTVSWSKGGAQLGLRGSGYRVSPAGALEIGQALPIHAGRYTCTARNSAGVAHKQVVLTVQASPVVKPLPSVVQVVEEDEVVLPCEASGIPQPSITWRKEGLSLPAGARTQVLPSGELRIVHASREDAGNYFCVAQNSAGSAMGKTRLVVQVPPVIETGLPDLSTTEGSHALLPCTAKGNPAPAITWEKDGQPVSGAEGKFSIQPSGELLVKDSESRDAGTYTCTAQNAAGRARRRVHLTIMALPVFTTLPGDRSLRLGERLWLRCAARGSPTPRIGWTVNDRPATEGVSEQDGGSTLQRVAVTREDSGTYVCWAENRVGRVQAISFVHVKEAPILQGKAFSYLVEPVGGSIRLDCVVHGDPVPNIRWNKDGLPLWGSLLRHQLQNGSLAIHRTEMDDAGRYQCLAENELGAVEKVVVLVLQSAPVFQVEPQDVTARPGEDVVLRCQATGEPVPTVEWLQAGQSLRARRRLRTLPDGSLWLESVEARDAGIYECVAHNLLGSAKAQVFLAVRVEPRGSRGSLIGVINGQEFGEATFNTSVLREARAGTTTIRSSISHLPASVGALMRILIVAISPVYWTLAGESGEALNGHSLTGGSFQQESHVEFATGELLTMTQVAQGLDDNGFLLLDMMVNGIIPESLAVEDLHMQDFQEQYVQTGPGQLFVGSTPHFLHGGRPTFLHCNRSIQYDAARGPQPQLVQHLRASDVSTAFDPEAEALYFQLTTALQAEENEVGCPEGFEPDFQGAFCMDKDECSDGPSPCSHSCHNAPGRFSCSCPPGFTLAWDNRDCRDVDECAWDTHLCQEGQRCVNLLGSYHCLPYCGTGFRVAANGADCEDVDECLEQLDECRYNQICENTAGSHRCSCPRGYRSQGPRLPCLDVNECLLLPSICAFQCHNLQGSYRCLCPPGQALLRDGKSCSPRERGGQNVTTVSLLRGPSVPWLWSRTLIPSGSSQTWVSLRPGPIALNSAGRAWCPPGFIRQNGVCTDLDECQVRSLCQHACRNTEGSYQCLCPAGYRLLPRGKSCQDINECEEEGIECGPSQMCFNTRGSYQCVDTPCPATYRQGSSPGTCFRRCSQDCSAGGPATLQYRLLPLPLGVRAHHDVARLAAFSEAGVPVNRTELSVLEPDPRSPFALRPLRTGHGAVYTRRALTRAGLYRLKVRAAAPRHQSVFVLLIAVSPYPY
ncbi:hemicentin-2 [Echinops telfairi]|uniref:Hemicentin-2 n=1 Tax=Echinops telfairi TaxID=9371 RepID=A0ABM0ZT04_ECHTE|nr:hemicentin-2 [Echinops telfairi]